MKPLRFELVYCFHCKKKHVDRGEWAEKNHSRHLCEHCGRFFFTKPGNVGIDGCGKRFSTKMCGVGGYSCVTCLPGEST